jgi:hypothetical protein
MTFIRRDRACCGQQARNWFHCADYIGLDGPKDDGRAYMTDYQVSKNCNRQ